MASKYARFKGKIPEREETEREAEVSAKLEEWKSEPLDTLTAMYNAGANRTKELTQSVKVLKAGMDALEILIRKRLDDVGADAVTTNGYTWSEKFEPYPQAEDPAEIRKYFEEHDMADQLELTVTELAGRLKKHVKAEAEANELRIDTEEVDDPTAPGGKREVTVVRSQIPGVKVFLKGGLTRNKAGNTSKGVTA